MTSWVSRVLRRLRIDGEVDPFRVSYHDEPDRRTYLDLGNMAYDEAVARHPDFDVVYLRAAYPTNDADAHASARIDVLELGLTTARVKSRILARMSCYYAHHGDAHKAFVLAVQALRTDPSPVEFPGSQVQCTALVAGVLEAHGLFDAAAAVGRTSVRFTLGPASRGSVERTIRQLAGEEHRGLVRAASAVLGLDPSSTGS